MKGFVKQYGESLDEEREKKPEQRSHEEIANIASFLGKNALINGLFLENIELTTTQKLIAHKLGRQYQGFIVVNADSVNNAVYSGSGSHDKKLYIKLASSGNVTVKLWIF